MKHKKAIEHNVCAPKVRCAIYVRKSTEENLNTDFNSLDAQRESCESYVQSRKHEGWVVLPTEYSDAGFTGANTERPALQRLLADMEAGKVDVVLVYKLDRLSRSLLDFATLVGLFEAHNVAFVSITQSFDSSTPMGRLCTNVLMSFSQFEREIIGERIRDKVAAAKRRGLFTGGTPPLGYDVDSDKRRLVINPEEAETVKFIFKRFAELGSPFQLADELNKKGITTKAWMTKHGVFREGKPWHKMRIYRTLYNRTYLGEVIHKDNTYPGEHERIVSQRMWDSAHAVIEENTRTWAKHARSKAPALLRGIIRCGACDRSMSPVSTQSRGKRYSYYQCGKASKQGYAACPVGSISAGEIEGAVMAQLRTVFRTPEMVAQTYLAASELATEDDNAPTISESEVRLALQNVDKIWDELYPVEQTRLVGMLVERVIVKPDGISIGIRAEGIHSLTMEMHNEQTV
ncbi:MAG: recombinase family protein [Armatimonadetes bacterium]|nr:recombinase family protein [Armatimonadota bacterium]